MATGERTDPFRSFNFKLDMDGVTGNFRECTGLSADANVIEYREGTDLARTTRKMLGLLSYGNITLRRGVTDNDELWRWYRNNVNGVTDRRSGAIILMDEQRNEVMRWSIENAQIKKIEAPSFNATANEIAVEAVELVHEGLMLES